jgi:YidC/Oxa1 family membrane protein insertase
MSGWSLLVDPTRALLFALAHLTGGSLGAAILVLSAVVRLALLPLGVRLALEGRRVQARLRALEPELARLRERFAADPARLLIETRRLQERHGIPVVPRGSLLNAAIQLPVGAALLRAITGAGRAGRFLWIADLARPDALLAAATAATVSIAVALAPSSRGAAGSARRAALVTGVVTLLVVWRLAAGVGLYWAASSAVGVAQSLVVRRLARREGAAHL